MNRHRRTSSVVKQNGLLGRKRRCSRKGFRTKEDRERRSSRPGDKEEVPWNKPKLMSAKNILRKRGQCRGEKKMRKEVYAKSHSIFRRKGVQKRKKNEKRLQTTTEEEENTSTGRRQRKRTRPSVARRKVEGRNGQKVFSKITVETSQGGGGDLY